VHGLDAALGELLYKNKESAKNTLIKRIEGWKRELFAFVSAHRDTLSPQDRGQIMLMQLLTENSNTMLAFVKGPNEMSFDSCLPQFQRINDLAEQGSIFLLNLCFCKSSTSVPLNAVTGTRAGRQCDC
jgi:hypothetical protein